MNFGLIFKRALQRAELPFDAEHLDLARAYANDNIQTLWPKIKAEYRKDDSTLAMTAGTDVYALDKYCDAIIRDTLVGPSTNPRFLRYKSPSEFKRLTTHGQADTGNPRIWTYEELRQFDLQLTAASVIKASSSLANVTTGTLNVKAGSKVVIASTSVFSLNSVGLRIKVGSDTVTYKIAKYHSSTKIELEEKYRGVTASTASYAMGDIGIHVNITGIVSGQVDSENLELNGTTVQTGSKSFTTVISATKSDFTGGRVTVTNNAADLTVATLSPAEFRIERVAIKVWPIPSASETLSYSFYKRHPQLRLDTDALLFKSEFITLLEKMTRADLLEWAERKIGEKLANEITEGLKTIIDDANDSSAETTVPVPDTTHGFGDQYYYSHDEDFA